MRTSKRIQILEAAARIVEREGVKSVTFDSVATEAGLTKGGLLYHFASREDLIQAIHQYLAGQWEADLSAAAGKSAAEATLAERLTAYTRVAIQSATRAELLFMLEGSTTPDHAAPWDAVMDRWAPPPPSSLPSTSTPSPPSPLPPTSPPSATPPSPLPPTSPPSATPPSTLPLPSSSLPATDPDNPDALDLFIARLAADGLWLYESLTTERLPTELRRAVAERITGTLTRDS